MDTCPSWLTRLTVGSQYRRDTIRLSCEPEEYFLPMDSKWAQSHAIQAIIYSSQVSRRVPAHSLPKRLVGPCIDLMDHNVTPTEGQVISGQNIQNTSLTSLWGTAWHHPKPIRPLPTLARDNRFHLTVTALTWCIHRLTKNHCAFSDGVLYPIHLHPMMKISLSAYAHRHHPMNHCQCRDSATDPLSRNVKNPIVLICSQCTDDGQHH